MKSTTPDNSDFLVTGVGEAGSAGDGKHIFFELIFLSGHRDRFHISFSDMDTVVLTLQAAVEHVAKEFSGQPEVMALRGARPESSADFAVGIAARAGTRPMVAFQVKHQSGLQNNIILSPDAAEKIGKGLIDTARVIRSRTTGPQN